MRELEFQVSHHGGADRVRQKKKDIDEIRREAATATAVQATAGCKKRRYTPRRKLFFNRVIYGRATIYRVTMPTDDCSVFTVARKKKYIPKEEFSHVLLFATSFRTQRPRRFWIFFFLSAFIKSASLPLRYDFFWCEKNTGGTKGNEGAAWDNGPRVRRQRANHAFNFYGIFGLKRQARKRAMYTERTEFSFCGIFIRIVKSLWLAAGAERGQKKKKKKTTEKLSSETCRASIGPRLQSSS